MWCDGASCLRSLSALGGLGGTATPAAATAAATAASLARPGRRLRAVGLGRRTTGDDDGARVGALGAEHLTGAATTSRLASLIAVDGRGLGYGDGLIGRVPATTPARTGASGVAPARVAPC